MQTSMPHSSTGIKSPPMELTVSTQRITSGYFAFKTSEIFPTGLWIPVEVSLCVMVIMSYSPVESASSTISGVVILPSSERNISAGTPLETAILYQRSPNAPIEKIAAFFAVKHRTAPSIRPLPDEVERMIVFFVPMTFCSFSEILCCRADASLVRWPIIGVAIFSRTSSRTSTGPGMKSFLCVLMINSSK